jgi:N-formylglutamate deformylase
LTPDSNTFAAPAGAPFFIAEPTAAALPILFDSPHSGIALPADFGTSAPAAAIRSSWDAFVDELWAGVPEQGGVLIGAHFPRAYIDPNRAITDIDVQLLAEPWPEPLAPEKYTLRGMGLIRRDALPNVPMYDIASTRTTYPIARRSAPPPSVLTRGTVRCGTSTVIR